jgi:3D (Asp-Asp-Asp) domain-containing protein
MPQRRLLPFAAVALVVLTAPTLGLAGSSRSGSTPSTAALRAENAHLEAKSRSAVLELYSLDHRLTTARSTLSGLRSQATALRAEQATLRQALAIARRGSRIAQQRLASRLRLLYEQGNVEPLEIVFGAKSLDEAITNIENLSRATGESDGLIRQLETARTRLTSASTKLAARRPTLEQKLREAEATAAALAQARRERSAYVASLASKRRLNDSEISHLVAAAQAAQARTEALTRDAAPVAVDVAATLPAPTRVEAAGGTITVSATGYALGGRTATGIPVGYGVAAVDPSVIPLGTHMTVPGYGEAVAADTGGSVVGATIDLWFPTEAAANAWGRRTVTIVLH